MVHGDSLGLPLLRTCLEVLATLDRPDRAVHFHLVHKALTGPCRQEFERMAFVLTPEHQAEMMSSFEFLRPLFEARAKAQDVLRVLEIRGVALTPEQRAVVESCTDPERLDELLVRAATARSPADVFGDLSATK